MKKLILLSLCIIGFTLNSQAQEIADHALGLRLGSSDGFGTEISYQHGLSENNRLEFDLGWSNRGDNEAYKLSGLYQWVWNIESGFNWYAGVGAGIGTIDDQNDDNEDEDGVFLNAAGDIGIEYNFDFPLLISLDFRPEIGILNGYNENLGLDLALGVRYQF